MDIRSGLAKHHQDSFYGGQAFSSIAFMFELHPSFYLAPVCKYLE